MIVDVWCRHRVEIVTDDMEEARQLAIELTEEVIGDDNPYWIIDTIQVINITTERAVLRERE